MNKVKNIVFLVLTSGISYGGITEYCTLYHDEMKKKGVSTKFIYFTHDYTNGEREVYKFSDTQEVKNLFYNELDPNDTIIISTRIGLFDQFFHKFPKISIDYPVIVEHLSNLIEYVDVSPWLINIFFKYHNTLNTINGFKLLSQKEANLAGNYMIDKSFYIPNPVKEYYYQSNYNVNKISFVGRLDDEHKNIQMLSKVAKKLISRNPKIQIHVYGIGNDKEMIENISENVIFHGYVKNKAEIYGDTNILISTSNVEGFPMVMLEAAGRGIPIVTTNSAPSISEFIIENETGFIIEHNDVDSFVEKVEAIYIDRTLRNDFSLKIYKTSLNYSVDKVTNSYYNEMNRVLNENIRTNAYLSCDKYDGILEYFRFGFEYKKAEVIALKKENK